MIRSNYIGALFFCIHMSSEKDNFVLPGKSLEAQSESSEESDTAESIEENHSDIGQSDNNQGDRRSQSVSSQSSGDSEDNKMSSRDFAIDKLRGSDNFNDWTFAMENYLSFKGYTDCITPKEEATPTIPKETEAKKLDAAKGLLVLCMESHLFPHVKVCKSAIEVWNKVHQMFEDRGHFRRTGLLQKLLLNRLENSESMADYIAKVMTTVSQLENIGLSIDDDMNITLLLTGLGDEFKPFIMGLGAQKITPDELRMKLLDFGETAQEKKGEAFLSKKNFKKEKKKGNGKKKRKCYVCKSDQHLANACPDRPSVSNNKKKEDTTASGAFMCVEKDRNDDEMIGNASVCAAASEKEVWYIDSGATSPMTSHRDLLLAERTPTTSEIRVANNAHLKVNSMGHGQFKVKNGIDNLTVNDILHVPGLSANLLSVYKMVSRGNTVIFNAEGCKIYNKENVLIASCKPEQGVYKLKMIAIKESCFLSEKRESSAMLWHRRFGHLNFQSLMKLKNCVDGIEIKNDDSEIRQCRICPMGKQHREPFPISASGTTRILELIHSDVCGPMENASIGGTRYVLTFIDDFSRKTFVYFLKHKSEVTDQFVKFKKMIENQTEKRIKMLRSDNGTEYLTKEMQKILNESGIEHQLTCTYTPQQNGVAERANRTIVERAKCMLFDGNLPVKLWAEACHAAVYLINRSPRERLNGRTPMELWSGEKPNVTHLKIFGSKVTVHVPKEKRSKWQPKAEEMIFLGYDEHKKGYRCFDPKTSKVIVSRDVKFFESVSSTVKFDVGEVNELPAEERTDEERKDSDGANGGNQSAEGNFFDNNSSNDTIIANSTDTSDGFRTPETSPNETSATIDNDDAADGDFTTRARMDEISTPRRSKRDRVQVRPFQVTHLALLSTEPPTVKAALDSKESNEWKSAMDEEIKAHQLNRTWTLVDLPPGKREIKAKWVFKVKMNERNEPARYKARLVAKGCGQRFGIDYYETFAPVVRHNSIRFLLAVAVQRRMKIHQMDVITAFLQGDLEEDIFMQQPEGYKDNTNRVCKLNKAVYGLKQAGRQWNLKLDGFLISIGFMRSQCDPCIYMMYDLIIAIYVDDFLIFYTDDAKLDEIRSQLHQQFQMKDIGLAKSCLGMNINQGEDFIELDQHQYVHAILEKFGMTTCKPSVSPSDMSQKMSVDMINDENSIVGKVPYQEVVGSLLYLANATRPDLAFATSDMSRFNSNHAEEHWIGVKRILRYLKGTSMMKLRFSREKKSSLHAFCDADWGSELDDRKSRTGYVLLMSGGAVSWSSKKQSIVALSSTEAEYISLSSTVREILWTVQLAEEIGCTAVKPVEIYCDNQSAIELASVVAYRPRTKHIDIRHHHIRDQLKEGIIRLTHVTTDKQVADSLTKAVTGEKTAFCAHGMGLTE